ncbi:hypothetical protein [Paraburkholderia domus]|uniref:hypothetical protein n=1 Tax=Paraburkholderia domus TaxID=2793075 RepID=UPI0019123B08|nr:hypothetical protein [Paraburkholderia domus]MBK5061729.1 hypothetical protein [Burkholderia sp. R-70199]CAE6899391.1 hypothetical protein R70199_03602 [Paraburkholderia domus]
MMKDAIKHLQDALYPVHESSYVPPKEHRTNVDKRDLRTLLDAVTARSEAPKTIKDIRADSEESQRFREWRDRFRAENGRAPELVDAWQCSLFESQKVKV